MANEKYRKGSHAVKIDKLDRSARSRHHQQYDRNVIPRKVRQKPLDQVSIDLYLRMLRSQTMSENVSAKAPSQKPYRRKTRTKHIRAQNHSSYAAILLPTMILMAMFIPVVGGSQSERSRRHPKSFGNLPAKVGDPYSMGIPSDTASFYTMLSPPIHPYAQNSISYSDTASDGQPALMYYPKTFDVDSLDGSNGFEMIGYNGCALSAINGGGDINNDGYPDVLLGSSSCNRVWAIFGSAISSSPFNISDLTGTNGFQIVGPPNSSIGFSVSIANINCDQYADILIGAPDEGAGQIHVIFGKKFFEPLLYLPFNQSTPIQGLQINGIAPGDQSGYVVSGVGDVNRDGCEDFVIGAPSASTGKTVFHLDIRGGQCYLLFGRKNFDELFPNGIINLSSYLTCGTGVRINGKSSLLKIGYSVGWVGDMNGDGFNDFILGTVMPVSPKQSGEAYVFFGNYCLDATIHLAKKSLKDRLEIVSSLPVQNLGYSVSGVGDANSDGLADIMVGAPASVKEGCESEGAVFVILGKQGIAGVFNVQKLNGYNGFIIIAQKVSEVP